MYIKLFGLYSTVYTVQYRGGIPLTFCLLTSAMSEAMLDRLDQVWSISPALHTTVQLLDTLVSYLKITRGVYREILLEMKRNVENKCSTNSSLYEIMPKISLSKHKSG